MSRGKLRIKPEETETTESGGGEAAAPAPAAEVPAVRNDVPSEYVVLLLADIDLSTDNPRKHFDEEKLQQLAGDISKHGVLQPVTVRRVGDRYKLVYGERRYRASKLAGLTTIPALVRPLTDLEVDEARLSENTGEPLLPMELADGYHRLIEKHGLTADQVAERVSRSRSHVYGVLKLRELGSDGRKAFENGQLSSSNAQLVARVPKALQADFVSQIAGGVKDRWGRDQQETPFREAQRIYREHLTHDVGNAPFDPEDATLSPPCGACSACPKRAGNMDGQFEDLKKSPNVCTDSEAYRNKVRAAAERKAAEKGLTLLSKKESAEFFSFGRFQMPHNSGWVEPGSQNYDDSKYRPYRDLLQPEQYKELVRVVVDVDGKLHEVLPKKGLAQAMKKAGIIKTRTVGGSSAATSTKSSKPKEHKPPEPSLEEKQLDAAIEALVVAVEKKGLTANLQKLMACELLWNTEHLEERRGIKRLGYGKNTVKELDKQFSKPSPAKVTGIVFEAAVLDRVWGDGDSIDSQVLKDAAYLLGVDLKKVCKETKEAEESKTIGGRPITHINGKPVKPAKVPLKKVTKAVAAIAKASKKSSKKKAA
jgi:ParB/RepB/Spo0J family partition protein